MSCKISIIIPTYNRVAFLKKALDNALPIVRRKKGFAEIVVCDNHSDDGTEVLMEQYQKDNYDILSYFRHSENYGYAYNFAYGIEHAKGEYVFLHGDDDLITHHFLDSLSNLFEQYKDVALIHFNYYRSSNDFRAFFPQYRGTLTGNFVDYYSSGVDFIKKHHQIPSFMSSNVFLKECWNESLITKGDENTCYGYEWLYLMYNAIIDKPCLFYAIPLTIQCCSGLNDYSEKMPLYSLVGLYNVFRKLDNGNGIYEDWRNFYHNEYQSDYFYMILHVNRNRELYSKFSDQIKMNINHKDIVLFNFCLKYLRHKCIMKIINRYLWFEVKRGKIKMPRYINSIKYF